MGRVLAMQAKRAANRAARKRAAMSGEVTVLKGRRQRDTFLRGYFDLMDGRSDLRMHLKSLPLRREEEGMREYRDRLFQHDPYLAGAWTAQRAMERGGRVKDQGVNRVSSDQVAIWEEELRKRQADDLKAAQKRRKTIELLVRDIAGSSACQEVVRN